ncbi:MAG: hypothetical protein SCK70_16670, partial [bacterium]|nr:hypothetical protein [bacterium]
AFKYDQCDKCVNTDEELIPILESALEKRAWIILTYHAIGQPEGYGYFEWDEFVKNVKSISERDFWNSSMNNITLYIKERQNIKIDATELTNSNNATEQINFTLSDGLANDYYDQPLTLLITIPNKWVGKPIGLFQEDSLCSAYSFDDQNAMVDCLPNELRYTLKIIDD